MQDTSKSLSVVPIPYQTHSEGYFLRLRSLGKRVWLDSGKPHSRYGRYDILTAAPSAILENPSIEELNAVRATLELESKDSTHDKRFPFTGGVLGYFNYEYNNKAFNLNEKHKDLTPSVFGVFHWSLIQDHDLAQAYLVFLPSCDKTLREQVKNCLLEGAEEEKEKEKESSAETQKSNLESYCVSEFKADTSKENYLAIFDEIKSLIEAGDTYQINFSQRFSGNFTGASDAAYLHLRRALPSPFSAYLELNDDCILSLSPERFIQVQDGQALTQPIKGTAARGETIDEDEKLAKALECSEKNRAENLMIVDLLRNDFSQACVPFSVLTPSLFRLESFANVHHLVSTVTGKLNNATSPLEFFLKCFPGGSITGAPKKRSMEIIQQLEQHPRNIYCGSVVMYSANGNFDSNIAIRTLLVSNNRIYCCGGGGIVIDSLPQEEFAESLQKINLLIDTLLKHSKESTKVQRSIKQFNT